MTATIPITLVGDNLGKRHLHLNTLVNEAHKNGENFQIIKNIPEQSPIDRLFKIDLASKIKDGEYIIKNLKDEDMLYVSRALKSTWLIEQKYEKIINPQHLEERIYPEMFLTAVTKMQHWIHHNLNDEARCLQFYQYYYKTNFGFAIKFLVKCSVNDIQEQFPRVMEKITPHYFKILCEKCPHLAKIFYDSLSNNDGLKNQYLNKENAYFVTLRNLLKVDADIVLDITEKYFNINTIRRFSKSQTQYIMIHHKKRFWQKPELYTAWLLNMQGLAINLDSEEIKKLVMKLARAKYIADWFNYKSVEPLIKRVKQDERALFKKEVFVTRNIGEEEKEWPYSIPEPPPRETKYNLTILDDQQPEPIYSTYGRTFKLEMCRTTGRTRNPEIYQYPVVKMKTLLDKLFDEYRFVSFGQTLYDLRKRITAESSPQNREFMLLVLVSKSGGRPDTVASLLELLARHSNEPPNVRAAVIRSLVKRASVWRLPEISWNLLLEFGKGLGLDGSTPVANCHEGLHAVVIRSLVLTGECEPAIQKAFLDQFSTLTDYSLTPVEKNIIANTLPKMLFSIAKENEIITNPIECIYKVIITLKAYKIKVDTYLDLIPFIITLAEKDLYGIKFLLTRLYEDKIARKQLFKYTFDLLQTKASYINALKHDITVIDAEKFADYYARRYIKNADLFLTKLSVYFYEENGLACKLLKEFKANKEPVKELGRPLVYLLKDQLACYLQKLDDSEDCKCKLLASAIRANSHIARLPFDIGTNEWKKTGAKFVANRVFKCQAVEIDPMIEKLLKWKRTARLALTLAKRTSYETKVFVKLAIMRPTIAIKIGLKLIKLYGDSADLQIWETIKPLIQKLDVTKTDYCYLLSSLAAIDKIPLQIRPEYSTVIYTLFKKISYQRAMDPLCFIEILLTDIDEQFIENLLKDFLNDQFTVENLSTGRIDVMCTRFYIRILVKYLFLCKTEELQKSRLQIFGDPFLAKMEEIRESPEKKVLFSQYLPEIIMTFRYNKVFLDTQYVSSLPVMEKVLIWMQKLFSIDKHFKTFAQFHLSMLYFKSVRQGLKLFPEVFTDKKRKNKEGVELVANIFGKCIAREVSCLKTKYFDSIPELYIHSLIAYLDRLSYHQISSDLLSSMIKGILEESKGSEYRIGIYLLHRNYRSLNEEHTEELNKCVNNFKVIESQWFSRALHLV